MHTFVRVVDLGSMTRAAESLFLAQSAVSTQVASLATHAGGPLLERRDGRLVPTRLGRILYDGASDVLKSMSALESRVREAVDAEPDRVAVCCTRTVCETSVARVVSQFAHVRPDLRLDVIGGTVRDAELRLRAGAADVALVEGQADFADASPLAFHVDRLVLALPANHELALLPMLTFEQAARYPFILRSPASGTRLLIEQRLGRRFEQLGVALELEGNAEIVSCVEAGIGIAFLSETAIAGALRLGTVVARELVDVDLSRTFYVAVPTNRPISTSAQLFVDWLTTKYVPGNRERLTA